MKLRELVQEESMARRETFRMAKTRAKDAITSLQNALGWSWNGLRANLNPYCIIRGVSANQY